MRGASQLNFSQVDKSKALCTVLSLCIMQRTSAPKALAIQDYGVLIIVTTIMTVPTNILADIHTRRQCGRTTKVLHTETFRKRFP